MIPLIVYWVNYSVSALWLINLIFGMLAFLAAFIVGMEYSLAAVLSKRTSQKTVTGNYSAEMFGSAAGAFAVTLFLIPAFGIIYTGIFLAVLNMITAGSLFLLRHKV
jgi:predicted membrane-bound spermidine synthase